MAEDLTARPARPFLRWAGSKRWLLNRIEALVPTSYDRYFEPFLGSGSVFFDVSQGHEAILGDTIGDLVSCYIAVRDHPEGVEAIARSWPTDKESFYSIRTERFTDPIRQAAKFIYLNKLCFNGLYRVNKNGNFNVPYGKPKSGVVLDQGQLKPVSLRLNQRVTISEADFEESLMTVGDRDLVYLDPPYTALRPSEGFTDYNSKLFDWDDQVRLAERFRQMDELGAYVLLSNTDHAGVRDLYAGYGLIQMSRYSSMAGNATKRGASSELVIMGRSLAERLRRDEA